MKLTIDKINKMSTKELKELRKKYNEEDHEFILYVIDKELSSRKR